MDCAAQGCALRGWAGEVRHGGARIGVDRHGAEWQARQGQAGIGKARHGWAWIGRHG